MTETNTETTQTSAPTISAPKKTKSAPKKKVTKKGAPTGPMYGAAIDLTGTLAKPSKLKIHKNGARASLSWEIGEDVVKKAGHYRRGDGRTERYIFVSEDKNEVKTWFKGVNSAMSLLSKMVLRC